MVSVLAGASFSGLEWSRNPQGLMILIFSL